MSRVTPISTLPEAWCSDPGLHVEATAAGLRLWGAAAGDGGALGLRFVDVSVELALRAGMRAQDAARYLLAGLPAGVQLEAVAEADGAQLLRVPVALALPVPEVPRPLVDVAASS
jgi:hypothetical protein